MVYSQCFFVKCPSWGYFLEDFFMKSLSTTLLGIAISAIIGLPLYAGGGSEKQAANANRAAITITDLAGREVRINTPVKKVSINWSGSGGAFMTMSALLGKDTANYLSSWDGGVQKFYSDRWREYSAKIPALNDVPDVSGIEYDDFNLEKIIALRPDAVIWTLEIRAQAEAVAEAAFAAAGIPLIYIDYHAETIENHTKSTRILGQLFNKEERAEEIIKWYTDSMRMINDRLAKVQTKPLVYVERAVDGPSTYGNSYGDNVMWGAVVVNAGGQNIGSGIIKSWAPLQPEFIISKNPRDIVLTGSYYPNNPESLCMGYEAKEDETQALLAAFAKRTGWLELDAVKNKRIYAIYHGLGREIYDSAALAFLAKAFHPDLFTDVEPMEMLRDYYKRFLPYDLYGVWMTKLR
jgi:iron complex transport system substrate-binding protein